MRLSKDKKEKISEQILNYLYISSPKPLFTSYIAREIARDEEFVKKILLDLKKEKLIIEIRKNPNGKLYLRRSRWKLTEEVFNIYKKQQENTNS